MIIYPKLFEETEISTAKLWMNLQTKYDLYELKQQRSHHVMPFTLSYS
ncbi:MAG: hypothetical protein PUJ68_05890 [[Actinobacillus] rossii]|nr:hypothetical protein [[Actinobacillus] rossii]MDY3123335.1 hypothetical protein [[Actinobacillus] rossii]MDY5793487.1 hypothetical protein [[Actinobacillus] rossii]